MVRLVSNFVENADLEQTLCSITAAAVTPIDGVGYADVILIR
jgi:hypothetical protein